MLTQLCNTLIICCIQLLSIFFSPFFKLCRATGNTDELSPNYVVSYMVTFDGGLTMEITINKIDSHEVDGDGSDIITTFYVAENGRSSG